jgi:hypothetical protein
LNTTALLLLEPANPALLAIPESKLPLITVEEDATDVDEAISRRYSTCRERGAESRPRGISTVGEEDTASDDKKKIIPSIKMLQ